MRTCVGMARNVLVLGTAKSAGLALKTSTDRIKAGRRPACSWPRMGSKSISQTSPRYGGLTARHSPWSPTVQSPAGIPSRSGPLCGDRPGPGWSAPGTPVGDRPPRRRPGRSERKIGCQSPTVPRSGGWRVEREWLPLVYGYDYPHPRPNATDFPNQPLGRAQDCFFRCWTPSARGCHVPYRLASPGKISSAMRTPPI